MINSQHRMDDATGDETVRAVRWPEGVRCPHWGSAAVHKRGQDERQPPRQRSQGKAWERHCDALSETIFEGHPRPLRVGVLCLEFRGLNLSHQPSAAELDLDTEAVQAMPPQWREGSALQKSQPSGALRSQVMKSTLALGIQALPKSWRNGAAQDAAAGSRGSAGVAPWRAKNRLSLG